ncbi:MAG: V-type ATP synthase subunit E [Spirochaetaceae bacterium]|nr:V-type ATP synthase subunit E [Spirochaetaceae bacterium]
MEVQVQELLDKIKREGLEAAKAEAAKVVAEGQARAAAIVADAEREAAARLAAAKAESVRFEESGKAALSQASRDLILSFRDKIGSLVNVIVKGDVAAAFGPSAIEATLPAVLKALAAGGAQDLEALLSPADLAKLDAGFAKRLAAEFGKGVELKPYAGLSAGFRIVQKDGSAYYDFSADAVSELLAKRVNASLAEILRSAVKAM